MTDIASFAGDVMRSQSRVTKTQVGCHRKSDSQLLVGRVDFNFLEFMVSACQTI